VGDASNLHANPEQLKWNAALGGRSGGVTVFEWLAAAPNPSFTVRVTV